MNICVGQPQRKADISGAIIGEGSQQESASKKWRARQRGLAEAKEKRAEENRKRKEAAALAAEKAREEREKRLAREKEAREAREAAARQAQLQLEARRNREALVTEQEIVLGSSLITYGAGLDVRNVITGFDLCRVTIKNLPRNARQEEIVDIFTQQGIETSRFFVGQFKDNGGGREATVLMKAEEGEAIAIGLEGIEFRDHFLTFEVSQETSGNTMGSSSNNSKCLTVHWRVPSETFIVTYSTMDEARRKVKELDGSICKGEPIRAQMNQPPRGPALRYYTESSIKLTGFPIGTLPDQDIMSFSGSYHIRALTSTSCGLQDSHTILRRHLQLYPNIKMATYENLTPKPVDGNVRVKVEFETWEDAKRAYESIHDKRLQNSPIFRAALPNPLQYTILIPKQQYDAQKKQWDSLSEKTPGRDAHVHTRVGNRGDIFIQVQGQDKKAVGSLKVRVEHLVAGERLDPEFWHPSFLAPSQRVFFDRIYQRTKVYVRGDLKTRSLKVYGGSDAMTEEARRMVKEEVDRLAKLETTQLLSPASVGFFIRGGLEKLKELLGEENVTMSFRARGCHITVKCGEEGRHQLNRLIAESRTGGFVDQTLPGDTEKETCPICTDEISESHPEQLGCGHTYCSGCLRHYLESAPHTKTFPLVCIGDEGACQTPISIPQIRRFLQPQVFQALVEVVFRSYLDQHTEELKFCTTPDCQQIYRHTIKTRILQCPSCFSTICSACDQEAHEGMTCQERRLHKSPAEQERLFDEWVAQNGKRCPDCRSVVEKNGGCNHITCRCGAHFCWRCERTFSPHDIYQHMTNAHGGMYDETPALDVDVEEQAGLLAQAYRQREIQAAADRANRQRELQAAANQQQQIQARQQETLRAQAMEQRRRLEEAEQRRRLEEVAVLQRRRAEEQAALCRRQNTLLVEENRRQRQIDEDVIRRQTTILTQIEQDRRHREAPRATQKRKDSGSWCIIM